MKKAVVLSSPGLLTGTGRRNTARSPGAYIVSDRLRAEGYEVQNIEYITEWLHEFENISKLQRLLRRHFKDGTDNIVCLSITVGHHDILQNKTLFELLKLLKKTYNVRIAAGGVYRQQTVERSVSNSYKGNVPEPPIVMQDTGVDDCWNKHDILSIELGVGCKFNCSFCTTPFKKTNTLFQTVDNLVYTMSMANEKYGITHFNMVDETSNEVDKKYENLLTAVRQLSFQPIFTGYARLDMVAARPYQIEQMAEIGIRGLFFGIETFHEQAAKMIRKGGPRQRLFDTLAEIKTQIPDLFRFGSFITGLTHDNEKSIRQGFDYVLEHDLLHNYYMNPLTIPVIAEDDYWASDISKTPEKFGYTITGENPGNLRFWKNDWTDWHKALELNDELKEYLYSGIRTTPLRDYNNWEYIKDRALGSTLTPEQAMGSKISELNSVSYNHIRNYIQNKSNG